MNIVRHYQIDEATYEDALRKPWPVPAERCSDGGTMCTDCEAQGRCSVDFEDSQRAALEDSTRQRQRQTDRLVNWAAAFGVVAILLWAVFA